MNALMRIHVRIINEASAGAKKVQRDINGMGSAWNGASGAGNRFAGLLRGNYLEKYGKNLQWTGRQLTYNFTLPLLAAGGAAGKFALDNEKAMTRLEKVYGDLNPAMQATYKKEIPQLERAFTELSNIFGVHKSEVIEIGAAWAAAGSSGIALARQTRATLEAMIIGDMDSVTATKALIAIQAQYRLSSKELTGTLAMLNVVENTTAVSMEDLIVGFQRSAGAARTYGVDARHLAASIAALVPATGGAEQAGNALKTIYTRLMVPTRETAKVLEMVGINMGDQAWQSKNATERLEALAVATNGLTNGQKAVVGRYIASNWQVSRFSILMEQLTKNTGYYQRALDATADSEKNMLTYTRELGIYLSSQPQAFSILWNQLRNAMAEIIVPLIPAILALTQHVVSMVHAFTDLSPGTQQMILLGLAALAALGPIVQYGGAVILLFSKLKGALILFGEVGLGVFKVLGFIGANVLTLARLPFSFIASGFGLIGRAFLFTIGLFRGAGLRAVLGAFVGGFVTAIKTLGTLMIVGLGKIVLLAGSAFVNGWAGVMAAVTYVHRAAVTTVNAVWGAMVFAAQLVWGAVVAIASTAAGLIPLYQQAAAAASRVVWAVFTGSFAALVTLWPAFVAAAGVAITTTWTFVTQALAFLTQVFAAAFTAIWTALPAIVRAVGTAMVLFQRAAWTAIVLLWNAIPAIASAIGTAIAVAFSSPWGWVALAVIAFVVMFRNQIGGAIRWVRDNWREIPEMIVASLLGLEERLSGFPKVVLGVFISVLRIIKAAALQVYEWLSYINPFARHSPSLVEQVTAGVELIGKKYASLSNIGRNFRRAISDLKAFGAATADAVAANRASERSEMRSNVVAVAPGAGGAFDALAGSVDRLYGDLARVGAQYAAQESVVARWSVRLDAANRALDEQDGVLKLLTLTADRYGKIIDAAQAKIDKFASAPLAGMRAMGDQIFANEMAQKRLQLQMLEWEKVNGPLDDIESRLSAITGDIETLRAEAKELRMAGAGSDITGPIEAQVAALEAQAASMRETAGPMQAMQDQLEALQTEGERLSLLNSLSFDPLQRQIDQLVEGMNEMPFDDIVAGIKAQQAVIAGVTPAWEAATAAQERQQAVVDALTAARDRLQVGYDKEKAALDQIGTAYDAIETQIRDMEQAMSDFASMAEQAISKAKEAASLTAGQQAFLDAGAGDYEIPGGMGDLGREEGDINALADQWAEEAKKQFGSFDIFGGFKDMWNSAKEWVLARIPDGVREWGSSIVTAWEEGRPREMWNSLFDPEQVRGGMDGIKEQINGFWQWLKESPIGTGIGAVVGGLQDLWKYMGPGLIEAFNLVKGFITDLGSAIGKELENWAPMFDDAKEAIGHILNVLGVVFRVALGVIIGIWTAVWPILKHTLKPIFDAIVGIVRGVLEVIRGVIGFVLAIINGDWGKAWDAILTIIDGIWDTIYAVIKGGIGFIIGIIRGFVEGVVDFFTWLWDVLVGHSIVPDMINAIIEVFGWLVAPVRAVFDAIAWVITNIVAPVFTWLVGVVAEAFPVIAGIISWAWENVIKPIWTALKGYITETLIPAIMRLWQNIQVGWALIVSAIRAAWAFIKPIWEAVKNYLSGTLGKAFTDFKVGVSVAWDLIRSGISTAWDKIKEIFNGIKKYVQDTLQPIWNTLAGAIVGSFNFVKEAMSGVWDKIKSTIKSAINGVIGIINDLIGGMNTVVSYIPGVDFTISEIPVLREQGGPIPPGFAQGTAHLPHTKVGHGFKTSGARAIVGEGRVGYPEYVIPTDPRYRARALALAASMMKDLSATGRSSMPAAVHPEAFAWGGLPSPSDAWNAVSGAAGAAANWTKDKVVETIYKPISDLADDAIGKIPWDFVKAIAEGVKGQVDDWVFGVDSSVNEGLATIGSSVKHNPGVNMNLNPDFLQRYALYNMSVGNPFTVVSGLRTRAQQEALYAAYLNGTGNLAAKPGTSRHESGYALDHAPGTRFAIKYMDAAKAQGLHYPVRSPQAEDWHIEPIVRAMQGGVLNMARGGRFIARPKPGGHLVRVGEAGQAEGVTVEPLSSFKSGSGDVNIYGNLEFPNITDPEDAQKFIDNLRDLTGGD